MWLVKKLRRRLFTPASTNHCVLIWSHATCYIKGKIIALHTRYERWRRSGQLRRAGKWYFSTYYWFSGIPTVTSRELYFRSWKQAECSLFVSVKVPFFQKKILRDSSMFYHVLWWARCFKAFATASCLQAKFKMNFKELG